MREKVFEFVLKIVAERGLVKGERIGIDGLDDGGQRRAADNRASRQWQDLS